MNEGTFRKSIINDGRIDRRGRLMSLIIREHVDYPLSVYESRCFALSRHSMSMKLKTLALAFAVWVTSASIDRASHKRRSLLAELPTHRKKQKSLPYWLSILRECKMVIHEILVCLSSNPPANNGQHLFQPLQGLLSEFSWVGWLIVFACSQTKCGTVRCKAIKSRGTYGAPTIRRNLGNKRRRHIGQICHPSSCL